MSDDTCPHGVNKKKWGFDYPPVHSMRESVRMIYLQDADACPDCLTDRVRNMRRAVEILLRVCGFPPLNLRRDFEEALALYRDDICAHMGPLPLRPTP